MTDCSNAEVRDQLPDLLNGRLDGAGRARVEAHVRGCEDCTAELNMLRAIRGASPAPPVNVAQIVAALPAPRRTRWASSHVWQIAAAVVFLAAGGSTLATYVHRLRATGGSTASHVASRQDSAGAAQGAQGGDVELNVGYGYSDLTDAQLEALLKDVEELKAVPMADPETSIPNVTIGNGGV